VQRPAGEHVVVALELVDVLRRLERAVELDEQVRVPRPLAVAEAQLDRGVRLDGPEPLDLDAAAVQVGAQEAVRRPPAGQLQIGGAVSDPLATSRAPTNAGADG
jgi:hypothetical protein